MIKFIFLGVLYASSLQASEPASPQKKSLLSHFKKKAPSSRDNSLKDPNIAVEKFEERIMDCYRNIEKISDYIENTSTEQSKNYLLNFKDFLIKKYMHFWNSSKKGDLRPLNALCRKEAFVIESFTKSVIAPETPISKLEKLKNIELGREYSNYIKNNKQYKKPSLRDKARNVIKR